MRSGEEFVVRGVENAVGERALGILVGDRYGLDGYFE